MNAVGARLGRSVTKVFSMAEPVGWAIAIGILLVQDREAVNGSTIGLVVVMLAEITALHINTTRPWLGAGVALGVQLCACAAGIAPTIAIGAVVVCAASLLPTLREDAGVPLNPLVLSSSRRGLRGILPPLAVLAGAAVGPWLLDLQAGALLPGPARAHDPLRTMTFLVFAFIVRMNWNALDSWLRGARKRAEEAESARDAAVAQERARIARELHDVVAHQMSVVVAQAQGAEAIVASQPDQAQRALAKISQTTRAALVEMRRLVAIDRPGDIAPHEDGAAPMPGLGPDDLAGLAGSAEAAGLRVSIEAEFERADDLPPGAALSGYRALQEALTNAAKHAPGSDVRAVVRQAAGALTIEVVNGPPRGRPVDIPGAGVGLVGMRERVELFGGTLTTGPTPEGGWSVRATFPTLVAPPTSE